MAEAEHECLPPEQALRDAVAADQAETFLIVWLQRMDDDVDSVDPAALLDVLLRIIGAERAQDDVWDAVEPGRAARHTAARCICRMYESEAPRPLFQLVGTLLSATQSMRAEHVQRHVAVLYVATEIFRVHGDKLHSMLADTVAACQRTVESSATPLVRAHALALLEAALANGAATQKDLQKTLRNALADTAGPVVRGAAACLAHERHDTAADAEALVAACVRVQCADPKTARAVARLAGTVLAQKTSTSTQDSKAVLQPLFSVAEQLEQLHGHLAKAQTWPAQAAILHMYHALFTVHGAAWIEANYAELARHVVTIPTEHELAASPGDAARLCAATRALLRALGSALREPAQEGAAAALGSILSTWPPPTPDVQSPSDSALTLALIECGALVSSLGCLPPALDDAVYVPAVRALSHPSGGVRAHAAWCIGVIAHVQPSRIATASAELLGYVRRDVSALTGTQPDAGVGLRARLSGHASALAALVHAAAQHPLYTSCADADALFALATELLEQGGLPVPAAAAAIQTAWTLLAALFSFGRAYAKARLPLFLTLWRNALGRAVGALGDGECAFLCHVRLHALAALLVFFAHGGADLLTSETSRRVAAALDTALQFVDHVSTRARVPSGIPGVLAARDAEPILRARIFRCAAQLADNAALAPLHTQLVSAALQSFGRPERYAGSAAQAQINANTGAYTGMWSARDNYAYGVCSYVRVTDDTAHRAECALTHWRRGALETWCAPAMPAADYIDALGLTPVVGSLGHDVVPLITVPLSTDVYDAAAPLPTPLPPATALVDAALELFAAVLPHAPRDAQISTCELLNASLRHAALDRNPGRRMAVLANYTTALLGALRTTVHSTPRGAGFANDRVSAACRGITQAVLLHGDHVIRGPASELYGRLAAAGGAPALGAQVQFLVEQIVDNRNADARASCALAAGEIYRRVGGLSAAPLTNTLSSLLMSLAADAHPAVHYNALDALCRIVDVAGLGFQSHVKSALALLVRLYAAPTHEPEGGSPGSTIVRATLPVYAVLARTVGALIGVLGPDLPQSGTRRSVIGALLHQLVRDAQPPAADALDALQHLSLVAPGVLESESAMRQLGAFVQSGDPARQRAAVSAYYQLVQRGLHALFQYGGRQLLATLLALVDADASIASVRAVLAAWLQQSAPARPVAWIDVCRSVLLVPGALSALSGSGSGGGTVRTDTDDEDAVIQLEAASGDTTIAWRTHLFVLDCVHDVLAVATDPTHGGAACDASSPHSLASRVSDLIKIAVGASSAPHTAVRVKGLQILCDVVERFHDTPDPAFPDTPLLEQFQAPITAAIMPAFASESAPEVLALAVRVSAVCITAGIERGGGRIERQLVAALEQTISGDTIDSARALGPGAAQYVRLAVLVAWAMLQVAPAPPPMLAPRRADVIRAWIAALTLYASARVGADAEPIGGAHGVLAPLVRVQVLDYFGSAWPRILQAVAVACTSSPDAVRVALDGGGSGGSGTCIALYGLAFETLCDELAHHSTSDRAVLNAALSSLAVFVDARYSSDFLHTALFDELLVLIQRAFLVEDTAVQLGVIRVVRALVLSYRERLLEGDDSMVHDDALWSTKLGALLRAVHAYIVRLPAAHRPTADKAALLGAALHVSLDMAQVCTTAVQADLVTNIFGALADYARREDDAAHMLASVLPILRPLCARACALAESLGNDDMRRVVHGYLSAAINEADALRARAGPVVDAKRRNALVSVGLAMVALDARIPVSAAVAERFSFFLAHQLRGSPTEALGALQCMRPIVLACATNSTPILRALVGMLTPPVAHYLACTPADGEHAPCVESAFDVLHLTVRAVPDTGRARALCITLPVFVLLVRRAGADTPTVRTVCTQLVSIAQEHALAFKSATAALHQDDRALVHDALKRALNLSDAPTRAPRGGTTISLRTFGS